MNLNYRVSRMVHALAFTRGKGLWNVMKSVFQRLDRKPNGLLMRSMHSLERMSKSVMYGCEGPTRGNFNTLKNQGYHFEHNYGHGHRHLSVVLAMLMMLAFLVDQTSQLCCALFGAAWKTCRSKRALWEGMREMFHRFTVGSMRGGRHPGAPCAAGPRVPSNMQKIDKARQRLDYIFATRPLAGRCTAAGVDRQERKGAKPSAATVPSATWAN